MYLPHYHLSQKPFQISPDPRFLWSGKIHKEALAMMEYGILNNQGFLVLTGDVGTGKTTLINALVNILGDDVIVAAVFNPLLPKMEFFHHLATNFHIKEKFNDKLGFLRALNYFLHEAYNKNKKVLLIIDEAQNLSRELLEEVRLLSNIEKQDRKLLNIFFVGQNEFNEILMKKELRPLRQRITITFNVKPLTVGETQEYISHRLKIAGCKTEIFTKGAVREIHSSSRGYPRLINIICDHALLTGYAQNRRTIKPSVIRECAQELGIPAERTDASKLQAATTTRTRRLPLARIALYTPLLVMTALTGYLFASNRYDDQVNKVKTYYGRLFSSLPIPGSTPSFQEEETKKPVVIAKIEDLPEQEASQNPEELIGVDINTENPFDSGEATSPITEEQSLSLDDLDLVIPFNYNTNELSKKAYESLNKVVAIMLQDTNIEISVKGYTDTLGSYQYNKYLATFRANIVKGYLVGKGVDPERIRSIGVGEENPLKANKTAEGREANRRVEIELSPATRR